MAVVYINPPSCCDACRSEFGQFMYDARTRSGQWGNFCHACFQVYCDGLGAGRGQKYELTDDQWVKVEG